MDTHPHAPNWIEREPIRPRSVVRSRLLLTSWILALTLFYATLLVTLLVNVIQRHPLAWASLWQNLPVTFVGFVATAAAILWGVQRWRERSEGRRILQEADEERVQLILGTLGAPHEDTTVRVAAALALGKLQENTKSVALALREALQDKDPAVSSAAALALLMREGRLLLPRLAHDQDSDSKARRAWLELNYLAEALVSGHDPRFSLGWGRIGGPHRDNQVDPSMAVAEEAREALHSLGMDPPYEKLHDIEQEEEAGRALGGTPWIR